MKKYKFNKDKLKNHDEKQFVIVDEGNGKFHVELKEGLAGTTVLKKKPSLLKRIFSKNGK